MRKVTKRTTLTKETLRRALKGHPCTMKEIAQALGYRDMNSALRKQIKRLTKNRLAKWLAGNRIIRDLENNTWSEDYDKRQG